MIEYMEIKQILYALRTVSCIFRKTHHTLKVVQTVMRRRSPLFHCPHVQKTPSLKMRSDRDSYRNCYKARILMICRQRIGWLRLWWRRYVQVHFRNSPCSITMHEFCGFLHQHYLRYDDSFHMHHNLSFVIILHTSISWYMTCVMSALLLTSLRNSKQSQYSITSLNFKVILWIVLCSI